MSLSAPCADQVRSGPEFIHGMCKITGAATATATCAHKPGPGAGVDNGASLKAARIHV